MCRAEGIWEISTATSGFCSKHKIAPKIVLSEEVGKKKRNNQYRSKNDRENGISKKGR